MAADICKCEVSEDVLLDQSKWTDVPSSRQSLVINDVSTAASEPPNRAHRVAQGSRNAVDLTRLDVEVLGDTLARGAQHTE